MTILSRVFASFLKLPSAETHDIKVEKNLKIPMPDGAVLLANHYYPHRLDKRPTILICSVYNTRISSTNEAIQ